MLPQVYACGLKRCASGYNPDYSADDIPSGEQQIILMHPCKHDAYSCLADSAPMPLPPS